MPIRTNRGRTAVYRRLWGWPLRSPRHLVTTIVALIVVAVVIALLLNNGVHRTGGNAGAAAGGSSATGTPNAGSSDAGTSSLTPATSSAVQTRLPTPTATPQQVAPSEAGLSVIQSWAKAWVNHPVGMTNQQWLAQLQPFTDPELLPQMASVNLANIQATQVTGLPVVVHSYPDSVEATLQTNGGTLDITAINTGTTWQVSQYNPAG